MRVALLTLALTAACAGALPAHAGVPEVQNRARALGFTSASFDAGGRPEGLFGNTGLKAATSGDVERLLAADLASVVGLDADNAARVSSESATPDGMRYYRMQQTYRGLPVWGDGITVQTERDGSVSGIFGAALPVSGVDVTSPRDAASLFPAAVAQALAREGVTVRAGQVGARQFQYTTRPQLTIYAANGHAPVLAWAADVQYLGDVRPFYARLFVDARSGNLLNSYTYIQEALNRSVSNLNGSCVSSNDSALPGPVALNEGGTTSDTVVRQAYNNLGRVYWFFKNAFGRDSYNNAGGKLTSSVRATIRDQNCSGDNAFWNGQQMVVGKGGTVFKDLNGTGDVTYHELGHGVTQYTSGLNYQYEPGGLNEASSDIYASMVDAWVNSQSSEPTSSTPIVYTFASNVWQVGEGLRVNGGGPLRYMNDPAADGVSIDRYSQYVGSPKYQNCVNPSGSNDYCGVHTSSGIANLAWYLLNVGGKHPRNATTINVTAIPMTRAAKYFYEAHTSVLGANDGFTKMRNAMQARARANGSVGACDEVQVAAAWAAVGVSGTAPGTPTNCGGDNQAPTASFTVSTSGLTASFNGSGSSDPDGSIASYSWNFGDSTAAGSGASPSHTYGAAGTYTVTLTVTDNAGATNSTSKQVTVSNSPGNQAPVAAFTATPSGLSVAFNGSGSSDPDGTISSYSWNFGDSTAAGSGATPSHTYAAAGTYTVTLTVTDNGGATNSTSKQVTVTSGGGSCPGTVYSGSFSGAAGQTQYQPNGNYYYSATSGTHTVCLTGPSGTDYDIYLDKWSGSAWVQVAKSETETSSERIAYTGTSGYYVVRVVNYAGTGSYTLSLQKP